MLPLCFIPSVTTPKDTDSSSTFVLQSFHFHFRGAFDIEGNVWLAGFLLVLLSVELKSYTIGIVLLLHFKYITTAKRTVDSQKRLE